MFFCWSRDAVSIEFIRAGINKEIGRKLHGNWSLRLSFAKLNHYPAVNLVGTLRKPQSFSFWISFNTNARFHFCKERSAYPALA